MNTFTIEDLKDSVILIDKPFEWSSFGVIKKLRGRTGIRKMGHAGTLDPLASGLLIICTGKKTKEIESFQNLAKEYVAEISFGGTTPTFDAEFPPENIKDCAHLTRERIEQALLKFTGEIEQVPPIYSAIKLNGKRAYEFARKGKTPELKSRTVTVHKLILDEFIGPDYAKVTVVCTKGTYIRSLVHDLGQLLETGAWVKSLRRTAIGDFRVENALKIDDFAHLERENKLTEAGNEGLQNA